MDGSNNFEQQFVHGIQADIAKQPEESNSPKNRFIIISIVLTIIIVIESAFLVILLLNQNSDLDEEYDEEMEYEEELDDEDGSEYHQDAYYYKDSSLSSFNLICTSDDSSSFEFYQDNSVKELSSDESLSGTYSIVNSHLVSLSYPNMEKERVLYYDGSNIADGLTIYYCNENYESEL